MNKWTNKQTNEQMNKQASKQASKAKQTKIPTNKETNSIIEVTPFLKYYNSPWYDTYLVIMIILEVALLGFCLFQLVIAFRETKDRVTQRSAVFVLIACYALSFLSLLNHFFLFWFPFLSYLVKVVQFIGELLPTSAPSYFSIYFICHYLGLSILTWAFLILGLSL